MTPEQAIELIKQIQQRAYKTGTVQVTPEVFDLLSKAIEVLTPKPKEEEKK